MESNQQNIVDMRATAVLIISIPVMLAEDMLGNKMGRANSVNAQVAMAPPIVYRAYFVPFLSDLLVIVFLLLISTIVSIKLEKDKRLPITISTIESDPKAVIAPLPSEFNNAKDIRILIGIRVSFFEILFISRFFIPLARYMLTDRAKHDSPSQIKHFKVKESGIVMLEER